MKKVEDIEILPQKEFPFYDRFIKVFPTTDRTIFVQDWKIYSNYNMPDDLIIHELCHCRQQDQFGLKEWIEAYLNDPKFRLEMEIEACRIQIASINDRNRRWKVRHEAINNLCSGLYGFKPDRQEINRLLKIKP